MKNLHMKTQTTELVSSQHHRFLQQKRCRALYEHHFQFFVRSFNSGVVFFPMLVHVHNKFISGHHRGSVGYLSHKLGSKSTIKSTFSLLFRDQQKGLKEGMVFGTLFSKSCSYNLCKVRMDIWLTFNHSTEF